MDSWRNIPIALIGPSRRGFERYPPASSQTFIQYTLMSAELIEQVLYGLLRTLEQIKRSEKLDVAAFAGCH